MANINTIQTNFTAGELSPRLGGRQDVERYNNGVKTLRNFLPQIHGGAKSLPLLQYVDDAFSQTTACKLIPFKFASDQAHVVEVTPGYMRIFNADGSVAYSLFTGMIAQLIPDLKYCGQADTLIFFHPGMEPRRLRRFAADQWVYDLLPLDPAPFIEKGEQSIGELYIDPASIGAGRKRLGHTGAGFWLAGDVGRTVKAGAGELLIDTLVSADFVEGEIISEFDEDYYIFWELAGTPVGELAPDNNLEIGDTITLTLGSATLYETANTLTAASYNTGSYSEDRLVFTTAANHGLSGGELILVEGCEPLDYNGTYRANYDSATIVSVKQQPSPGAITTLGTLREVVGGGSTVAGFRDSLVGKHIRINGGLVEITEVLSTSQIKGTVRQELSSDVAAYHGAWEIMSPLGLPGCGCFYQQRLVLAGYTFHPHTIAFSTVAQPYNFEIGTEADSAFIYDLFVSEFDPIVHVERNQQSVVALTGGSEYVISGGIDAPLSVSSVQVDQASDWGCNDVRPVRVGAELIFASRNGLKLRAMGYRFESDTFQSADITKLSEHITTGGIIDMVYQQEPDSLIWMVKGDGTAVILAIDREENVAAWARFRTPGTIEAITVIPSAEGPDIIWLAVLREIAGSQVRTIEKLNWADGRSLHCAITGTEGTATDTISGLDHFDGQPVQVIADGLDMGEYTPAAGSITLPRAVTSWAAGLTDPGYIETLQPNLATQQGSAWGDAYRIREVMARLINSTGLKVAGQLLDGRDFGAALLDQQVPTFSGDVRTHALGWNYTSGITLEQATALPCHILAIMLRIEVN